MTWLHQCRTPGDIAIRLRRRTAGAIWECRCGQAWILNRRRWETFGGGYSFWEWAPVKDADNEPEPQPEGAHASTELAQRDPGTDDGGYQYTPDIRVGFCRNDD